MYKKIIEAWGKYYQANFRYIDKKTGMVANKDRSEIDINNGFFDRVVIKGSSYFIPKTLNKLKL